MTLPRFGSRTKVRVFPRKGVSMTQPFSLTRHDLSGDPNCGQHNSQPNNNERRKN
jgi:hypothetical protein